MRGCGGYVICPDAVLRDGRYYRSVSGTVTFLAAFTSRTISYVQQGIVDLIDATRQKTNKQRGDANGSGIRERSFAQAALQGCAAEVAATAKGERNTRLNATAYRMGRIVARGWISRNEVENALIEAMHSNGYVDEEGIKAAAATLQSGSISA